MQDVEALIGLHPGGFKRFSRTPKIPISPYIFGMPWSGAKRTRSARAPVSFIDPCLPTRVDKAPSADGWVHEIKHDGYRMQIHVRGGRVRLYTMTGVDWTDHYPLIVESAARIKGSAILDAEACVQGADGVTDFAKLHARGDDAGVMAYAFDVMMKDGDDVRALPWSERNVILKKLLKRSYGGIIPTSKPARPPNALWQGFSN